MQKPRRQKLSRLFSWLAPNGAKPFVRRSFNTAAHVVTDSSVLFSIGMTTLVGRDAGDQSFWINVGIVILNAAVRAFGAWQDFGPENKNQNRIHKILREPGNSLYTYGTFQITSSLFGFWHHLSSGRIDLNSLSKPAMMFFNGTHKVLSAIRINKPKDSPKFNSFVDMMSTPGPLFVALHWTQSLFIIAGGITGFLLGQKENPKSIFRRASAFIPTAVKANRVQLVASFMGASIAAVEKPEYVVPFLLWGAAHGMLEKNQQFDFAKICSPYSKQIFPKVN